MEFTHATCVSQNEARKIIALRGRKGLFWTLENGRYIGIDNHNGDAFVETFDTLEECERWLRRE